MLIRAKFTLDKEVRYISHLELMSTFRRAFRRAAIVMAYSQGFNPHPVFSLGQPLPVGMTGKGEYFDLETEEEVSPEDFIKRVNCKLPPGITIIKAVSINSDTKSLMAIINTAVYDIKMIIEDDINEKNVIEEFLKQEEIKITRKRRKKDDREINIRPLIDDISVIKPDLWRFVVRTGSNGNLRPEEAVRGLVNRHEGIKPVPIINIERKGLYVKKGEVLYQPYDEEVLGS